MINEKPAIIDRMFNRETAICLALFVAIMSGIGWMLRHLANTLEFSNFMIFCGVACAGLLIFGAVFDGIQRRRR